MPELPEVETVKEGLKEILSVGEVIQSIEYLRKNLRDELPSEIPKIFKGAKIESLDRRAKYINFRTNKGVLVSHLGMTGTWRVLEGTERRANDHILIHFRDFSLVYNDPRRFGVFDYFLNEDEAEFKRYKSLGPEPLDSIEFHFEYIWKKSRKRKSPIKNFIMDQKIVVGVGNIYAVEALFSSGIRPTRKTDKLTQSEMKLLVKEIKKNLRQAIKSGGSTISDFKQAGGESGYFQHSFKVYDKEGESCVKCKSSKIKKIVQAGRSSFYCSNCQS